MKRELNFKIEFIYHWFVDMKLIPGITFTCFLQILTKNVKLTTYWRKRNSLKIEITKIYDEENNTFGKCFSIEARKLFSFQMRKKRYLKTKKKHTEIVLLFKKQIQVHSRSEKTRILKHFSSVTIFPQHFLL